MRRGVGKTLVGYTFMVFFGGGKKQHRSEQTTNKWEADVHAKKYEKGRRSGKDN